MELQYILYVHDLLILRIFIPQKRKSYQQL